MEKSYLVELAANKKTSYEIAELLGKSQTAVMYWLKKHGIKLLRPQRKPVNECINCGEKLALNSAKVAKYCSNSCHIDYDFKNRYEKFISGEQTNVGSRSLSRLIEKRDGRRCKCCNLDSWMGKPIPLEVEHIDGNSENNLSSNLVLICPNCHALTPTYKGKNAGNGRHARRIRYREGKSY